jgi:hypothetical protein
MSICQSIREITLIIFQANPNAKFRIHFQWSAVILLLTMWGADGLMASIPFLDLPTELLASTMRLRIWRCVVLYQDVSRVPRILTNVLMSLLVVIFLGGQILFHSFHFQCTQETQGCEIFVVYGYTILALLIVGRLIHHQRHIQKDLGADHGSPYSKVIIMCVESSGLIVISSCVYIALRTNQMPWAPILSVLLPHICVSPHLMFPAIFIPGHRTTHCLSRRQRSRDDHNFTAIGARDGTDSLQQSDFEIFQSRGGV